MANFCHTWSVEQEATNNETCGDNQVKGKQAHATGRYMFLVLDIYPLLDRKAKECETYPFTPIRHKPPQTVFLISEEIHRF